MQKWMCQLDTFRELLYTKCNICTEFEWFIQVAIHLAIVHEIWDKDNVNTMESRIMLTKAMDGFPFQILKIPVFSIMLVD